VAQGAVPHLETMITHVIGQLDAEGEGDE
jgi:hypothetical protein